MTKQRKAPRSACSINQQGYALLRDIAKKKNVKNHGANGEILQDLLGRGAITYCDDRYAITDEGKQALRRFKLAIEEDQIFAAQNQLRRKVSQTTEGAIEKISINDAESPLALLASRRRRDGSRYLTASQIEAGERLRSDFERGQLTPAMGINWDKLGEVSGTVSKRARTCSTGREISDSAMAAQMRFRKAVSYVGEELADMLIDFCCFLKGLEEIERCHHLAARSAKEILSLALLRLARHYGLKDVATGPASNAIRHWGTRDYRPKPT